MISSLHAPESEIIKNYRFVFVTDDMGSITSLMKTIMPANSLNFWGGTAGCYTSQTFLSDYVARKLYNDNDIIILSKFNHFIDDNNKILLESLEQIRDKIKFIFCEASEEASFSILDRVDEKDNNYNNLKKLMKIIDCYLYESELLKDEVSLHFPESKGLFTRHPHSNCSNIFNPYSPIGFNDQNLKSNEVILKEASKQHYKQIETINILGYMGRPKYCHNLTALNRCCYELSHKLGRTVGFYSSNPGINNNFQMSQIVDFGLIHLYRFESNRIWYDHRSSNKILALWSLGIPCIFSKLPTYMNILKENNLDENKWSFKHSKEERFYNKNTHQYFHQCSLNEGSDLAEKVYSIVSDSYDFEIDRRSLFNASYKYNPINIAWLYEEMFEFILSND